MTILTKKYRLIWDENGKLLNDPLEEFTGSETYVGEGRLCFESDDLNEILEKL